MTLLNILKNGKNMRRIFGKKELFIIEKQLMGMKLKPSEKTRLSRDIRKKFEAIKELAAFQSYFNLKHGRVLKDIIDETKDIILESGYFLKIKRIYLFGSTAEKSHIFRSDIDIAIEFYNISETEAGKCRRYMLGRVNKKVDIQIFNILPEKIKKEILEKGRIIYEKQN